MVASAAATASGWISLGRCILRIIILLTGGEVIHPPEGGVVVDEPRIENKRLFSVSWVGVGKAFSKDMAEETGEDRTACTILRRRISCRIMLNMYAAHRPWAMA